MISYLKIVIMTLLATVIFVEFFGQSVGIEPKLKPLLQGWTGNIMEGLPEADKKSVDLIALASEEQSEEKITPVKAKVNKQKPFEICHKIIKSVSLHPEFTRIAEVKGQAIEGGTQFVWNRSNRIKMLNSRGREVSLPVICKIDKSTENVIEFMLDGQKLLGNVSVSAALDNWSIERSISKVDNSTNVQVTGSVNAKVEESSERLQANIVMRCFENSTSLHLTVGEKLVEDSTRLAIQLDQKEKTFPRWRLVDAGAVLMPQSSSIGLIKLLMKSSSVGFDLKLKKSRSTSLKYDLSGLRAAIYPLQQACHWK